MLIEVLISASLLSPADTLAPAIAVANKEDRAVTGMVSGLSSKDLQRQGINNPKELAAIIPGLYIPDYGASLTSTIYVRGMGSRMENPVMGLSIDDFPILDKNSYDLDYLNLSGVRFLHGPQGTSFGRNALSGVLSVRTAHADGLTAGLEYGSGHHVRARLTGGSGQHSWSAAYRHSSGFFRNEFNGKMCDPYDGGQFQWRWEKRRQDYSLSNLLLAGLSHEGGFAYGAWDGKQVQAVNYNDEASYSRITVLEGFKVRKKAKDITWDLLTSLQILADRMRMDQDYTPASVFTLEQSQRSAAQTVEFIVRPTRKYKHWKPVTGFFGFFKANRMLAPVLFKEDGIQSLILDNANAYIPAGIGRLTIPVSGFTADSRFTILSWNAALYHESAFTWGRWQLTAGLRIDYEGAWMGYDCLTEIPYRMVPYMSEARTCQDTYTGALAHGAFQLLPKLAVQYNGPGNWHFNALLSKGYRAGGFNTQIFSDILQNRLMNGLMADLGVYLDRPAVSAVAGNTEYQPEELWNWELGLGYKGKHLTAQFTAFYDYALNQQITVFPPGLTTGRMMTNAGKSQIYGAEAQAAYRKGGFTGRASWSWNRYIGRRIPYSPEHTLFASAGYSWEKLALEAHLRGIGPIYWDEENTLREPLALTLGARVQYSWKRLQIYLQGENLTGRRYRTFYFKSMGKEFFQLSKPVIVKIGLQISLI